MSIMRYYLIDDMEEIMKKESKMRYRCSCCNNPVNTNLGYFRFWDESHEASVKICVSCDNALMDTDLTYVEEFIDYRDSSS